MRSRGRLKACKKRTAQLLSVLVVANRLAHILATAAKATRTDLRVDKFLAAVGLGNVAKIYVRMVLGQLSSSTKSADHRLTFQMRSNPSPLEDF